MVITKTPFRVSLFGGGTDYPQWYAKNRGLVISGSIDKYCYLNVRYLPPFFDYRYRIRYTQQEYASQIDDIKHPSVRECIRYMGIREGLEIQHNADVPAMSGLGSSSAFTVGLLHSLYALQGKITGKRQLAGQAVEVEQKWIKENVGSQDQVAVAFGGFNMINFGPGDCFEIRPLTLRPEVLSAFEAHMVLCFTGFQRIASDVAKDQVNNIPKRGSELKDMAAIADEAFNLLQASEVDFCEIGELLRVQWNLKKRLSNLISNSDIDNIYETGMACGAYGGKLLGAGAGGFMLFIAPPEKRPLIREKLQHLVQIPFHFENQGSTIIYYVPSEPFEN